MKAQTAFAAAFIAALFLPPLLLDRTSVVSQKENRNLAQRPAIIAEGGGINRNYFSQLDAWLGDRFGLREPLVALDSVVKNRLKSKYALTDRALEGKDGWIFLIDKNNGNLLPDFCKLNLLDENAILNIESNVHKTIEWCTNNGIKVLYLIAPNKHSVYTEYYPFDRPEGITRADQIVAAISRAGADCLFPRDLLFSKKAVAPFRMYFKVDSHWNALGAYYASEVICERIKSLFPNTHFPKISYCIGINDFSSVEGDLNPLLNKPDMEETGYVTVAPKGMNGAPYTSLPIRTSIKNHFEPTDAAFSEWYEYIDYSSFYEIASIYTRNKNANLPRALVFRDSFFRALEPFVSPLFSEVNYVWKDFTDADKEQILKYKPDIVIFERVERYAPNLGLVR